jgi:hypothetical protein
LAADRSIERPKPFFLPGNAGDIGFGLLAWRPASPPPLENSLSLDVPDDAFRVTFL